MWQELHESSQLHKSHGRLVVVHRWTPWCSTKAVLSNLSTFPTSPTFQSIKRQVSNMSSIVLSTLASSLYQNLQGSFWRNVSFHRLQQQTQLHAQSLAGYADYFSSQNKLMKAVQDHSLPVWQMSESMSVKYIELWSGVPFSTLQELLHSLQEKEDNHYLAMNDLLPDEPGQKYEFIQCLERNGLSAPIMLLTYLSGNNVGNLHFVWKVQFNKPMEETFQDSVRVIEKLKPLLPQYHMHFMHCATFEKFGSFSLCWASYASFLLSRSDRRCLFVSHYSRIYHWWGCVWHYQNSACLLSQLL